MATSQRTEQQSLETVKQDRQVTASKTAALSELLHGVVPESATTWCLV
jgi:hypothetical protein